MAGSLSNVRADRGGTFWLWFTVKLAIGVAQMVGALAGLILFVREGPSSRTMTIVLCVALLTTVSMALFKVLGWKPVKR